MSVDDRARAVLYGAAMKKLLCALVACVGLSGAALAADGERSYIFATDHYLKMGNASSDLTNPDTQGKCLKWVFVTNQFVFLYNIM